jgi:hypothetical protein
MVLQSRNASSSSNGRSARVPVWTLRWSASVKELVVCVALGRGQGGAGLLLIGDDEEAAGAQGVGIAGAAELVGGGEVLRGGLAGAVVTGL